MENKDERLQLLREMENEKDSPARSERILVIVMESLRSCGLNPILVGGKAVELYTRGQHVTFDIDLVLRGRERAGEALLELGFEKNRGERHWYHSGLQFALEIPDDTLAGNEDLVNDVELDFGVIRVIGIEDLILDRMRACKHWTSQRDCDQAESMLTIHYKNMDHGYLETMALREGLADLLEQIRKEAKNNREKLGLDNAE